MLLSKRKRKQSGNATQKENKRARKSSMILKHEIANLTYKCEVLKNDKSMGKIVRTLVERQTRGCKKNQNAMDGIC